jgi:hypothetical protein
VKDTYQVVSIKDGKQDLEAILQILRQIKAGNLKNDLRLLNYYNEVPISYAATIDKIEADCVECSPHQAQSVALGLQKQTLLTSSAFPQGLGVHCFVEYVNVRNCFAVLGRFAFASIRAQRRGAVRVRIIEYIPSTYSSEGQSLEGRASDISVTGLAIQTRQTKPVGLQENGNIQLAFQGTVLVLPTILVSTIEVDGDFTYTFKIEADKHADKIISQYIYSRQVEIIRELKEQFQ